jgi:hypothetical protein
MLFGRMPPIFSKPGTTLEVRRAERVDEYLCANVGMAVVLMGPEQNMSVLSKQLEGHRWAGAGVGYGVRGARGVDLTLRFKGKPHNTFFLLQSTDTSSNLRYHPYVSPFTCVSICGHLVRLLA